MLSIASSSTKIKKFSTASTVKDKSVKTIVLAGGVAANSELRLELGKRCKQEEITLHYPSMKLCTDNAGMIAAAAYFKLKYGNSEPADLELNGIANLSIEND